MASEISALWPNTEPMMVYDALRIIGSLKGKLAEYRRRAAQSVTYFEAKKPAFDALACMQKANEVREELVKLQAALHHANATAHIVWDDRKITVDEAIRRREEFKSEIAFLGSLGILSQSRETHEEFAIDDDHKRRRIEKVRVCALPEAEHALRKDAVQSAHDRINMLIERSNRATPVHLG